MLDRPGGDARDDLVAEVVALLPHAERLLDLGHHVLVGILEPPGERVAQLLLLGPVRHVRDVLAEQVRVLPLLDQAHRRAHLVVDDIEELLAHDVDELLVLVVAARQRLLLQELVDGDVLDQLLHLLEDRERRDAGELAVLRGVEQEHLDLARAGAGAPLVVGVGVGLAPDLVDAAEELLGLLGRQPVGRAAVRVELGLLERRQLGDQVRQPLGILLGQRLTHAGQASPTRRRRTRCAARCAARRRRRGSAPRRSCAPPRSRAGRARG